MKGHAEAVIAWCLTLIGLKKRVQTTLSEMVEADLAVAGAVARAYTLHDAEAYACELEQQGEVALAAEIRRQVAILVPAIAPGSAAAPAPPALPPVVPAAPPTPALSPLATAKRRPGRPPKNPQSSPPASSQGTTP